jgi:uncharacterized protein YfcZ (UPF0381/DUF406 family)
MSSFDEAGVCCNDECGEVIRGAETLEEMERRHKAEVRELEGKVRALLKTAKKSNKGAIEAQAIQMEYDLKARHREEMDSLEEQIGKLHVTVGVFIILSPS